MSSYQEVADPQYALDSKPLRDNSTYEKDYLQTLSDQNPPNYSSQIRVEMKDTNNMTNLSLGFIQVDLEVLNGDGTALAANANVAIVNNIASIFSRTVCRINNVVVETNELSNHCNHLKSLLGFSSDYANSVGSNMGVSPDTSTHNSDANCLKPVNADQTYNETHNKGFYDRRKLITGNNVGDVVSFLIPLTHLFGSAVNKVMINNSYSIEFTRNSDVECLYGADSANCKIRINELSLWLPRITPSPLVQAEVLSQISAGITSPYMFETWSCYDSNDFAGNSSITQRVISQSERPVWVFTYATLATTAQVNSPYHTPLNCLKRVQCRVNGKLMPSIEYNDLDKSRGRSRAYNDLVQYSTDYLESKDGLLVNRDDYVNNLIVAFDVRALPENLARSGNVVEILATAGAPIGANVRLHTVVVSHKGFDLTYGGGVPRITMM